MLVQHGRTSNNGKNLFYYTCSLKRKSDKKLCNNGNAKASYVEGLVINSLKLLTTSKKEFLDNLKAIYKNKVNSKQSILEVQSLSNSLTEKKTYQIGSLICPIHMPFLLQHKDIPQSPLAHIKAFVPRV